MNTTCPVCEAKVGNSVAGSWPLSVTPPWTTVSGTHFVGVSICPDLLRYEQIGAADNWRGRTVRGFFWLLDKVWP